MGNTITSYKGRAINFENPVEVYRNLSRKGKVYSIRQFGRVVAHATAVMLRDAEFKVSMKGVWRIRKSKTKQIVAWISGYITDSGMGTDAQRNDLPAVISFNPHTHMGFECHNLTVKPFVVAGARVCILNHQGVRASYTY